MHNYIFEFEQETLLQLKLNIKETLLLHYLVQFFSSTKIKSKYYETKRYCFITYKKIMDDLPILDIDTRQIGRIFFSLEDKKIIKRFNELKNHLYVWIDYDLLSGQKSLTDTSQSDKNVSEDSQKCPAIVNNNNNKLNIIYYEKVPRATKIKIEWLEKVLLENLATRFSPTAFEMFVKETRVQKITTKYVVLSVKWKEQIQNGFFHIFEEIVFDSVRQCVKRL
ncbi:MAG: hypothetical protein PHQ62_03910 [Clostridia bacterium]|nr:hypothetical protein [Clostridia bacterium]